MHIIRDAGLGLLIGYAFGVILFCCLMVCGPTLCEQLAEEKEIDEAIKNNTTGMVYYPATEETC